VEETVGPGVPVFQSAGTLKVFYDFPGQRRYYVQWTAPPLSNLPGRYYNWSVYVPPAPPRPAPIRMAFTADRFMRPAVEHRDDTILLAGRDGPVWSGWYGYHEAIGTLKSFRQGEVRPYTRNRLFAMLSWAVRDLGGDANRVSCVGSTDALYYGVRHGDRFAYVQTTAPDPDPQTTPPVVKMDTYVRRTDRPRQEAAWGKVEWAIPTEGGGSVWDHMNLTKYLTEHPKAEVAFLSMGPATLSAPWTNERDFMKQMWASKQPFCAQFFWGSGTPLPVPEGRVGATDTWDFALGLPMLALRNNSNDIGLDSPQFTTGKPTYGSGGRIATGRRWLADCIDEPGRFEITVHGGGQVVYAGGGASDVTIRRTRKFRPAPGEKLHWENVPLAGGGKGQGQGLGQPQSGDVVADENGLVTIPQVSFREPSRLKVTTGK
jgi:hypothetical protein